MCIYIYIVKTGEQRGPTAIELLHIKISKCPLFSNEHLSILEPYPASSGFYPLTRVEKGDLTIRNRLYTLTNASG